jgi:hypothetical protein
MFSRTLRVDAIRQSRVSRSTDYETPENAITFRQRETTSMKFFKRLFDKSPQSKFVDKNPLTASGSRKSADPLPPMPRDVHEAVMGLWGSSKDEPFEGELGDDPDCIIEITKMQKATGQPDVNLRVECKNCRREMYVPLRAARGKMGALVVCPKCGVYTRLRLKAI